MQLLWSIRGEQSQIILHVLRGHLLLGLLKWPSHWEDMRIDKDLGRFILIAAKKKKKPELFRRKQMLRGKIILGVKRIRKERIM